MRTFKMPEDPVIRIKIHTEQLSRVKDAQVKINESRQKVVDEVKRLIDLPTRTQEDIENLRKLKAWQLTARQQELCLQDQEKRLQARISSLGGG